MAEFIGRVNHEAFVSLATNNGYALGALVLGQSLRSVNTNRQLALMITRDVDPQVRQELLGVWDRLIVVDVFDSEDSTNLALIQRPDLGITFTKLHAWKLVEYNKCVFLDADTLVLQNVDDLFNRPEISAAPDTGWPDCFNSGVFVFVPSLQTHDALVAHALAVGSFDGGDQGLLNSYFNDWFYLDPAHRLPFVYNLHSNSCYTYTAAFRRFGGDVKIVHFIGSKKPWQYAINLETGQVIFDHDGMSVTSSQRFVQQWWDVYNEIAAHRITGNVDHETSETCLQDFHPLRIGSDSDDSDFSEPGSDSRQEIERVRSHEAEHAPPDRIAPALAPNQNLNQYSDESQNPNQFSEDNENEHNHTYAINPQSTPSQSHEISQITSSVGSLQFRSFTEETHDTTMTSSQELSGQWRWEYGQVDYVGIDRFENILRRLEESLVA